MYTDTFTVDDIGDPEPILVPLNVGRVQIREADPEALTPYYIRGPFLDSPEFKMAGGSAFVIDPYHRSQSHSSGYVVVGYIRTEAGTVTFAVMSI